MIFDTTVIIVVISPNVDRSEWVKWEVNYATGRQTRNYRQSQPDGVVKVMDGGYQYASEVSKLIDEKSNPVTVQLEDFLRNPQLYIEKAYEQRRTD